MGELGMGQTVLAAPRHVYTVADELEDERRESRRFHVLLVSPPAEARLQCRGVRGLQGRFVSVALEAQCLEILGLCGEGLVHGDDVVQLARGCGDGGRAELALMVLLREQGLPRSGRIAGGLEKVKEDLARGTRQTLPAIGEFQPPHPGLQHIQVFLECGDDAVLAAPHPQPQAPPLAHASHDSHDHLRAVPLGQELRPAPGLQCTGDLALPLRQSLNSGVLPGFLPPRYLARSRSTRRCGRICREGVAVPAREGHDPLLLDGRLVLVQQAAWQST